MIHGMRYSEQDQILIGQAIEGGDGRSAMERKMDRLSQRVAYAEGQVQNLSAEVRTLRQRIAVLEGAEIETVCAWCVPHKHLSGPVGADAEHTSHGICPECVAKMKEAVA